ncbi:MAG: DUF4411 family protein [Chloroflexi bacterium]|nr:DUF4411 family protein [Chloroflexota bacterium]
MSINKPMQYCLDTNVYIEAHRRYYAFDIAPGFWEGLTRLAEQEVACSPILVYDEMIASGDDLARWARIRKDILFLQPDEATQDAFREIADLAKGGYEPQHVQKFLSGADPWVIAQAKAHQLIVVTQEALKNEVQSNQGTVSGKIQIPNMCKRVQVSYQDTFAMLREQEIVLR